MSIGNFHKDETAVAYLLFYIISSALIFGGSYAIIGDIRDATAIPIYNDLSPLGEEYNDADTLYGFDFLNLLFSLFVTFFVLGMMWFGIQMAQKPEQPW